MTNQKKSHNPKKRGQKKEKEIKDDEVSSPSQSLKIGFLSILLSVVVAAFAILVNKRNRMSQPTDEIIVTESTIESPPREKIQPRVGFFLSRACTVAYCHKSLKASHRTLRATSRIETGERLFEIPRSMQIWDLDALRDPFIRKHLFSASHKLTGNHPGNEAFLAAYLALQMYEVKEGNTDIDILRLAYFDMLPTLEEFDYHPLLANGPELKDILRQSSAYSVLESYRNMIISEYEAFADVSPEFVKRISKKDFFAARLNVLTRVIRVGPPGLNEAMQGNFQTPEFQDQGLLLDELQAYKDLIGLDLMGEGCIAMIPIADMFNHHPSNNVEFEYTGGKGGTGSFVVTVDHRRVEEGFEPMVSYGTMADSHLFARYGFINGDGSGHTQVSIAHHHDILRLNISSQYDYLPHEGATRKFIEFQSRKLVSYIKFDDGYQDCIPGPASHPEEARLKKLKHKHLMKIANDMEKWVMLMPPMEPYSEPAPVTTVPITTITPYYIKDFVVENYNMDKLHETCRLISIIDTDFGGHAAQILYDNLRNNSFVVGPGNDDLEFRSLFCVGRWIGTNLVTLERQGALTLERNRVNELNEVAFGTRKWAAYHVRFGEMQALQSLGSLIVERVNSRWDNEKFQSQAEFKSRDSPCPDALTNYLFEDEIKD
jgi:hypothetical protein